jgi:predicted negative regulator of RcsB-dependent stress response
MSENEIERLQRDCAEAYQVVGALAMAAGAFETDAVRKALDNLSAAANGDPRPHEDLLPFAV